MGKLEMRRILIITAILTAVAGAAFGQADRVGTRQWKLVQLNGAKVPNASRAYLELDTSQTKFTGHTGCNRMFGSVDVQGRRIDFLNVGSTKMACLDPRTRRTETAFVKALENADRFRVRGNVLELLDRSRVVMTFTAAPKQGPDNGGRVGLEDRKWTLEAIRGTQVSRNGRGAFIVFDPAKASAGGNSSCNVFGGSYTATGATLKITDVVSTMRACIEDDRMQIERDFLDGLRQANRFEIVRGKLMLYRNQRLLLTLSGEQK